MTHVDRPVVRQDGNPFAHFQWNYGWGMWEQVVDEAAGKQGVVAAYAGPSGPFADQLATVVARETRAARGDRDRMASMIERISASLGFAVAMAAEGDAATIDQLMVGAEAHAHAEAVEKAPLAELSALARGIKRARD